MAARSRTALFIQYRNELGRQPGRSLSPRSVPYVGVDSEKAGLIAHASEYASDTEHVSIDVSRGGAAGLSLASSQPVWTSVVYDIESSLQSIRDGLAQLEPLYKKHILPGFVDAKQSDQREAIEHLSSQITRTVQQCQRQIKLIPMTRARASNGSAATEQEERVMKNVQASLATKLQTVTGEFRRAQAGYLQRLNGSNSAKGSGGGGRSTGNGDEDTFGMDMNDGNSEDEEEFIDTGFTDVQLAQVNANDTAISVRTRDIDQVATRIHDLALLFGDLQTMVIDQGSVLDRIDYNVEQVHVNVVKANEELDKGEQHQKNSRKWLIVILLILAIVAVIILLVVKRKSSSSTITTTIITSTSAVVV